MRLQSVAPDLVSDLSALTPEEHSIVRVIVVSRAIEETRLAGDVLVARGLSELAEGAYGRAGVWKKLVSLAERVDKEAWDLREQAAPETESPAYLERFRQARALSSLAFALQDATAASTLECVYEAQAAMGDIQVVRELIDARRELS